MFKSNDLSVASYNNNKSNRFKLMVGGDDGVDFLL